MNGFKFIRINVMNKTLDEVAEIFGVSKQSIYLWESKRKKIPQKRAEALENLTGIPEKYFFLKELTRDDEFEIKKCKLRKEIIDLATEYNIDVTI